MYHQFSGRTKQETYGNENNLTEESLYKDKSPLRKTDYSTLPLDCPLSGLNTPILGRNGLQRNQRAQQIVTTSSNPITSMIQDATFTISPSGRLVSRLTDASPAIEADKQKLRKVTAPKTTIVLNVSNLKNQKESTRPGTQHINERSKNISAQDSVFASHKGREKYLQRFNLNANKATATDIKSKSQTAQTMTS